MWAIIAFLVINWYTSLFFQTFFLHRYAAHAQFTMSKFTERVMWLLTWIAQGPNYLSPRAYGILHRAHHAYADTEKDVHSPKFSKNIFDMMWQTAKIYNAVLYDRSDIEEKFKVNVPTWMWFDKFASTWYSRIAWGTLYVVFYMVFAPAWYWYLLLPIHFLMAPIHGAIINWFAHKIGYRNFEVEDTSTNLMKWDVFMMGEGLHNNHHPNANRPNFAYKRGEFDPSWTIIWTLNKLGIIQIPLKTVKLMQQTSEEQRKAA